MTTQPEPLNNDHLRTVNEVAAEHLRGLGIDAVATVDEPPDLLAELDAASKCAHGVDMDMEDYCARCEEPGQTSVPTLDFDALVHAVLGSRYQWVRLDDAVDMATSTARRLADTGAATITVDGSPADLHRPVGAMRRFVDARGLLEDEAEHDPARPFPYPPRDLSPAVSVAADALWLIDAHGCARFKHGRCLDASSGKKRGAEAGADAWCDACVARDALNRMAEEST